MKRSPFISYDHPNYLKLLGDETQSRSLATFLLNYSHKLLESSLPINSFKKVIEVGSGKGIHYEYVSKTFDTYLMTDLSNNFADCKKKYFEDIKNKTLKFEYQDASKLTHKDNEFDRLIAVHVLEHLVDPVSVLTEWNRVVKDSGIISLVLPCDPGLLWRLGRHFGPRKRGFNNGIEYDYQQAAEHVNAIFNLVVFIKYHFEILSERWFPSHLACPDINLFYICHIKVKK